MIDRITLHAFAGAISLLTESSYRLIRFDRVCVVLGDMIVDKIDEDPHLSRIETRWTLIFEAKRGDERAGEAKRILMERYCGAVSRYLLASVRDVDAAEELAQEFALRFIRGDFKNAEPGRGRFRDYVKRSVYHLMMDYHRARRVQIRSLDSEVDDNQSPSGWIDELDRSFVESWRNELLARAWAQLSIEQKRTGKPYFEILKTRVDHPDLKSEILAEMLSVKLGKKVDAGWVRVNLHRSRDRFVELLLREVASTLDDPTVEHLEEELVELDLYERCKHVLIKKGFSISNNDSLI